MAERVRTYVREWSEPQGTSGLPKRLHLDGLVLLVPRMDTKACEHVRANYAAKAAVLRLTDGMAAEAFEKVVEFWEAAAAMLKAAEVTTLGELLEDE